MEYIVINELTETIIKKVDTLEEAEKCIEYNKEQYTKQGFPAPNWVSISLTSITTLTCSCCGKAAKGRQWWNRDRGYGLCKGCIEFASKDLTKEERISYYGYNGVHYNLEGLNNG